jgi:hypothetical protein
MKTQPKLKSLYDGDRRRIEAGVQLFNAHYLLDSGRYLPSLKAYLKSFLAYPPAIIPDIRRVAFATASLFFNVDKLRDWYLLRRKSRVNRQIGRTRDN